MSELLRDLFTASDFMPHGHCYFWRSDVLWLNVLSDGLIAVSYSSIPFTLFYFVSKRKDLGFDWIIILFASFILSCGTSHVFEIITVWKPFYGAEGLVKLWTGIISFITAVTLVRLVPGALKIPSPAQLRDANEELRREIATRKAAEEKLLERTTTLERTNAELERFAFVASHDLKEPIRMVSNYTQLLAKRYSGKLDTDADEYIHYAVEGVERMQGLINDLLTYTQAGQGGADMQKTDLNVVLRQALSMLEPRIKESGAEIDAGKLPEVKAVPAQMLQVLMNLIENALKFHGKEKPHIKISAERIDEHWMISVQDNGIGIDEEYRENIFDIFRRLHAKEQYPGTGIGLAICRKIIEKHAGRIWVEPVEGGGSVFRFLLPAL